MGVYIKNMIMPETCFACPFMYKRCNCLCNCLVNNNITFERIIK